MKAQLNFRLGKQNSATRQFHFKDLMCVSRLSAVISCSKLANHKQFVSPYVLNSNEYRYAYECEWNCRPSVRMLEEADYFV